MGSLAVLPFDEHLQPAVDYEKTKIAAYVVELSAY